MLKHCVVNFMKNSFFDEENCLKCKKIYSIKKEYIYDVKESLNEILEKIAINDYKVLVQNVNEMKFGYYSDRHFVFSDDSNIIPKYLIQMRLFNKLEEILIFRNRDKYYVRVIRDEDREYSKVIDTVDSISVIMGKFHKILSNDFIELFDKGRKIKKIIPVDRQSDYYTLITRSYIEYNNSTGQAGYGYYRYVDIEPEE